ncbi:MAG: glycoside hydrolase family 2 protein, partial [Saprospiraceae bacterium]
MSFSFKQILLIIVLLNTSDLTSQDIQKLESNWHYKSNDSMAWLPCHIPNTIHKILFDSLLIADPFYSNNEDSLQYIGQRDYQFQTSFNIGTQTLSRRIQELHLTNIDTYADIYLNEILIGHTNNAFRAWKFDISKQLKLGLNYLRINLKSADRISIELYNQLPNQLPGGERVTCRKPQFHFGWDFGPKYLSCGILSVPFLTSYDDIELTNSSVHTKVLSRSHAHIELNLEINSAKSQIIKLQWSLDNQLFTNNLNLTEGKNNIKINAKLKNPKLWWPNGSGDSFLYDTRLQLINSENKIILIKHFNSGIRLIKLIHKQDKWGKSFYFNINGVDIFAKGANYIPQDIFQLENHPVHKILNDAFECGFNMLRVWGGGQYESDEFYETCDKLGIIIWQDFMFACGMYPGDKAFNDNIQIEAEEQIKRLSRFACIGLWCGNNENNEAWNRWGWQIGLGKDTKERLWSDYQNLFNNILPSVVKLYSNNNSYWES